MSEFLNKIISKVNAIYLKMIAINCGIISKTFCSMVNIKLQSGGKFYGLCKFVKTTGSQISIGKNCRFRSRATSNLIGINHKCIISTLDKNAKLIIGDNCGFSGTTIGCFKEITFGNNVNCGANTLITDSDWHPNDSRSGEAKAVNIGNNVWLGYGVIVLKGVSIGENSVIGAGSVVTKSIPANVIAAGNPCKVIKQFGTKDN